MAITIPLVTVRNQGDGGSFFAAQQNNPSGNALVAQQADVTAPQSGDLALISDPIQPAQNTLAAVSNFDPNLYDLRNTSHLMRLLRAFNGASGIGGLRKQNLISRLASMMADGSFLDLDGFYGEIFGLQRRQIEGFPTNLDGSTVNPYTDLANSDIWDDLLSRDARYRARLFQLARAVNMGGTYPGLQAAAEAVINCEVDIVESWVNVDLAANQTNLVGPTAQSYLSMKSQYVTYAGINGKSFGDLSGSNFGYGGLVLGNRAELVFTPRRSITNEEHYQLHQVLNTLKPSNCQVTLSDGIATGATVSVQVPGAITTKTLVTPIVNTSSPVTPRQFSSDSENWQIQSRVTPALNLINPTTPIYNNSGPYSQARPVYSEYTGEQWSYVPNVVTTASYRLSNTAQITGDDDQLIVYSDSTTHVYAGSDGVRDTRQAIGFRLSGEGVVTNMPYYAGRASSG